MESYYKLKSWCDAKDQKGVWRMGRIKSKKKNVIAVHFDGWSDRYKVFYCVHSSNLAPMRKYSRGYTGQETVALREWEFNENALRADESKMSKLTSSKFQGTGVYEITSFIRGDLFVHIDCLLTFTYSNPATDIKNVENFLMRTLHFCLKWMEVANGCSFPVSNYLNNANDAVASCGFEVFEMVRSILGFNKRTSKYFSTYKVFTSNVEYCKSFMSECQGFLRLTEKYAAEDFWGLLSVLPLISEASGKRVESENSTKYFSIVTSAIEINPGLTSSQSKDLSERVFNTLPKFVGSEKAECLIKTLRESSTSGKDFKVEISESSNGSVINHEELPNNLEELISPINMKPSPELHSFPEKPSFSELSKEKPFFSELPKEKSPFSELPKEKNSFFEDPKEKNPFSVTPKEKKTEPRNFVFPDLEPIPESNLSKTEFFQLQDLISKKFEKCMETIQSAIFSQGPRISHSLPLSSYLTHTADQCEDQILDRLEHLITQRNILEALKIVRWRKKICKIAILDGWELADSISKSSVSSLKVTTDHLIQANLSNFLMKFD